MSLLANPRIRARNREKARILIGERVPNITSTSTSTGFVSENVQYIDVGLKLEVEPTISLDDEVAIRVALEVSNIIETVTTRSGTVAYRIGTRNASTLLRLKDGENQVLAGLLSDEERMSRTGVPIISQPPILDRLFGARSDEAKRTEIVLSITPRLVRQLRRPDSINIEFDAGTEASLRQRATEPTTAVAPTVTVPARPSTEVGPSRAPITGAGGTVAPNPATQPPPAYAPPALIPSPLTGSDAVPPPMSVPPPSAAAPPTASGGIGPGAALSNLSLRWVGPSQVALRDDFSADLVIEPKDALQSVPVVIGFDPQSVQVLSVDDGGALSSGGAPATLNFRIDPANGQVFATVVRNATVADARAGTLLTVRMRALKSATSTAITVLQVQATLPDGRAATAAPVLPLNFSITP